MTNGAKALFLEVFAAFTTKDGCVMQSQREQIIAEMIREIDLAMRHGYYKLYPDDLRRDLIQLVRESEQ